jgi:hypothetical protein
MRPIHYAPIPREAGNDFGSQSARQQPEKMPPAAFHRIFCALVATFQFLDSQMRFKRDAPCHGSVLQRYDTTRYQYEFQIVMFKLSIVNLPLCSSGL